MDTYHESEHFHYEDFIDLSDSSDALVAFDILILELFKVVEFGDDETEHHFECQRDDLKRRNRFRVW